MSRLGFLCLVIDGQLFRRSSVRVRFTYVTIEPDILYKRSCNYS